MSAAQKLYLRGDSFPCFCNGCKEYKPSAAFTSGNKGSLKGLCNGCVSRATIKDQAFIIKRRQIMFEQDIKRANDVNNFMSEKELRG